MSDIPHEHFMREALKQAAIALEKGEVPVGAVVVFENRVIARAHNQMETLRDPTAHAEMIALTQASEALAHAKNAESHHSASSRGDDLKKTVSGTGGHRGSLEGAALYVTLEPCVMCAGALVVTKCGKLVYGTADAKAGACESLYRITQDDRLNHRLQVTSGVMAEDARIFLQEFFRTLRKEKR